MRKLAAIGLLSASSLFFSVQALADLTNGPDPYAAGFGFDTPTEAGWGWDRGDAGTIYAEWEHWAGASNPTAPDVGVSGTPSATFGWNPGTFPASSGNLYSFSGTEIFDIDIDGSNGPSSGPVLVTLQTETWGNDIGYDNVGNPIPGSILLNGAGPTSTTVTYLDPAYSSSFGPVALTQTLFTWALGSSASNYDFDLAGGPHMSFAQVAVDVGAVPIPAAALLFISGVLGLFGVSRRRQAV